VLALEMVTSVGSISHIPPLPALILASKYTFNLGLAADDFLRLPLVHSIQIKNIFIETLVKGSGPFLTKILQRFGNLETIEDEYRTKILKC
jgi:hypothetical protein